MKILCIGHASYDITLPIDNYPIENKKIRLEDDKIECGGGPAATAAYLLAKWNLNTYFAGIIGKDYYGDKIKEEFREIGVKIKYLETRSDIKTTTSYILANYNTGTRTILTCKDKKASFQNILDIEEEFNYILVDGDEFELTKKILLKNQNILTMIDAGKNKKEIVELSHLVKYLVCSNDFARDYTNLNLDYNDFNSLVKVYNKLNLDFKDQIIIMTLESYGSFTKLNGKYYLVPSIEVKTVDTTGAGDIYHGSLLYFLIKGYELLDAMKLANITSALSVTKVGGRFSIPTLKEVLEYAK